MTSKKIHSKFISLPLIAAGCTLAGSAATAQPMEVVTVEAATITVIGRSSTTGGAIKEIRIKTEVSYADLDLTTDAGAQALEKRVRDAAQSTCAEIQVDVPVQGSTEAKCVKEAVDGAMGQVKAAIEAKRADAGK